MAQLGINQLLENQLNNNMSINFNGKIFPSDQAIFDSQNRAFLYGDALFETIRMSEGKIPFLENHVNRLLQGCLLYTSPSPRDRG